VQTFSLKGIAAASSTIHPMSVPDPSPETNQPDPRMEALAALVPPPADPESGIDGGTERPHLDRQGTDTAEQATPLHQQREPREIEVYRMVTQANPANDRAWFTLGNNLKNHGRIVESIEAYETALALNPRADAYHFELAAAYASVREYQKAIQEFQEVIQLAPDNHFAHAALAACYRRLGESEEARKHTELVVARMQQESNYNRACFESIRGNQERAIDLLRAATAEDGVTLDMLENDSDLDFIRETTAFRSLVAVLAPQAVIVAASGKESR
jgi:tetratricopeptide (TPR) repeat protein